MDIKLKETHEILARSIEITTRRGRSNSRRSSRSNSRSPSISRSALPTRDENTNDALIAISNEEIIPKVGDILPTDYLQCRDEGN